MEAAAAFSRSVKVSLPTAKVLVRLQNPLATVRLPCSWLLSTLRGSRRRPNRAVAGFSAPAVTVQAQICSRSARHVVTRPQQWRMAASCCGPRARSRLLLALVLLLAACSSGVRAALSEDRWAGAPPPLPLPLPPPQPFLLALHCTAAWLPACI